MRRQSRRSAVLAAACCWIALCALAAPALGAAPDGAESRKPTPVDLNEATVDSLTSIPGIGRVTAQRIVDWREEHGPFLRVEDLLKVKGIGEKSLEKIRPYVKVSRSR